MIIHEPSWSITMLPWRISILNSKVPAKREQPTALERNDQLTLTSQQSRVLLSPDDHTNLVPHGATPLVTVVHRFVAVSWTSADLPRPTTSSTSASTVPSKKCGYSSCTPSKSPSTSPVTAVSVQPIPPRVSSPPSPMSSSPPQKFSVSPPRAAITTSATVSKMNLRSKYRGVSIRRKKILSRLIQRVLTGYLVFRRNLCFKLVFCPKSPAKYLLEKVDFRRNTNFCRTTFGEILDFHKRLSAKY